MILKNCRSNFSFYMGCCVLFSLRGEVGKPQANQRLVADLERGGKAFPLQDLTYHEICGKYFKGKT